MGGFGTSLVGRQVGWVREYENVIEHLGHRGHVFSMLAIYSDDQSLNPAEAYFFLNLCLKKTKISQLFLWSYFRTVNTLKTHTTMLNTSKIACFNFHIWRCFALYWRILPSLIKVSKYHCTANLQFWFDRTSIAVKRLVKWKQVYYLVLLPCPNFLVACD